MSQTHDGRTRSVSCPSWALWSPGSLRSPARRPAKSGGSGPSERGDGMTKVSVRYIVDDVDAAIDFYCRQLGFHEDMHPAPTFAMLSRGDLRLVLSAPGGGPGGGAAMPDGTTPAPGGWNRFQLQVDDLKATVRRLSES